MLFLLLEIIFQGHLQPQLKGTQNQVAVLKEWQLIKQAFQETPLIFPVGY